MEPRGHFASWLDGLGRASGIGLVLGLLGCSGGSVFQCEEAGQCQRDGASGTCEADGYCSFPDEICDSGRRYGDLAPAGLAGTCVPVETDSEATDTMAGVTGASTNPMPPLTGGMEGTGMGSSTGSGPIDDGRTTGAVSVSATDGSESGPPPPGSTSMVEESSSGPGVEVLNFPASVAACTEPVGLDPSYCAMVASALPGAITIDQEDLMLGPFNGYLRFDLDDSIEPGAVVSITLRMTTTGEMSADSTSSGEVWEVEPFGLADLSILQPATVGPMLAPTQGMVASVDVIEWPLPPELLAGDPSSVYFGLFPTVTNGVDYWGVGGMEPPVLIIEQMP